jgi:hypothetical protein
MTPARPELAARERIAALQQQADLARLARFPAAPPARPKPGRERLLIEQRHKSGRYATPTRLAADMEPSDETGPDPKAGGSNTAAPPAPGHQAAASASAAEPG